MKSIPRRVVLVGLVVLAASYGLLDSRAAVAAELKLIASPGVRAAMTELVPRFEESTGHKVAMDFAVIAVLKRRIAGGEAFDVVIPDPALIEELVEQGTVAADARGPLCRSGLALGVRKGTPVPDISTPENLKRALLAAKTVGHSKEGQSGVHFLKAVERLGIMDEMRPKLRAYAGDDQSAAMQRGELDIAVSGTGVIMEMPGAQFVGGLPPAVQGYVNFAIGVSATSKHPDEARALVQFLMAPTATPALQAKGLERY